MNLTTKVGGLSFQVSRKPGAENDRLHDGNPVNRFRPNPEDFTDQGFSWFNQLSSLINRAKARTTVALRRSQEECLEKIITDNRSPSMPNLRIRPFLLSAEAGGFLGVSQ